MKQIIPIRKDIIFKTKVNKITNISLEHDYKIKEGEVEGKLILSGTYKMTEASMIDEEFIYELPFIVSLSDKVKKDTIVIEIDDFTYEMIKDVMKLDVKLELSCEENIKEESIEEEFNNMILNDINVEEKETTINDIDSNINNESISNISSIVNENNDYSTYKVYIVRHGDTIESICNKYNIIIDDIKEYNDLTNINVGDKIVIPQINE